MSGHRKLAKVLLLHHLLGSSNLVDMVGNTGLGCNEKRVIEILGRRTQAQRIEIAQAYQTVYGESLHKRLKSAMSGKLEVCTPTASTFSP